MKIFFATSNPPHFTEKDTGILRRIFFTSNEKCWKTNNHTDIYNCEFCLHKHECSRYNKKDDKI
jgi:phage/plasmid-associated DNA primase